ncbi:MAG: hypothetical protein ACRDHL_06490 [Candidatus Promineifilaceae bacterium]
MGEPANSGRADERRGADGLQRGVTEVISMSLALAGSLARLAAEATAGGRPLAKAPDSSNPLNAIAHYSIASVVNVVNAVAQGISDARSDGPPQLPTVRSGASLRLPMSIQNPGPEPLVELAFVCLGVRGGGSGAGRPLDETSVRFEPQALSIEPLDFEKLTVFIDVPPDTSPGRYEVSVGLASGDFESAIALQVVAGDAAS